MGLSISKGTKIIAVVGPNASGKSELGVKLAKKLKGEIISADSRQVYKGLNIGSGKVEGKWENKVFVYKNIPHHCIDIADPKKTFSALDFKNCAQKAMLDIFARGKTPIIVGGTGFYIDAALDRMKLGEAPPNPKLRKKLAKYSIAKLLAILGKLDPERAKTVEQKNPVRLIRAIEIAKFSKGNAPSQLILAKPALGSEGFAHFRPSQNSWTLPKMAKNPFRGALPSSKVIWLGIKRPPEELKKRIHVRLLKRLNGITQETRNLHKNGVSWKRLNDLGLEYRYAGLYLQKHLTREEFIQQLEMAIWHYAKRQMTWFKRNKDIHWIKTE